MIATISGNIGTVKRIPNIVVNDIFIAFSGLETTICDALGKCEAVQNETGQSNVKL